MAYKILCVGAQWLGSDDGGLFRGFQKNGHIVKIVDPYYYFPFDPHLTTTKVVNRLANFFLRKEFNHEILLQAKQLNPDIIIIYKGRDVTPTTIKKLKESYSCPIICVYPDISFFTHGKLIPQCIPLYDHIFTTKSFHIEDLAQRFHFHNVTVIHHAIDKDIHFDAQNEQLREMYACDVCFIGGYSKKKEAVIEAIIKRLPDVHLQIWGGGWENAGPLTQQKAHKTTLFGMMYPLAIQAAKINLGIVAEKHPSSFLGDQVTARSFNIPGSGGFMLHEKTEEFESIFTVNENAVTYESIDDLIEKIQYYLENDEERNRIKQNAYEFVQSFHSHCNRADEIVSVLKTLNKIS